MKILVVCQHYYPEQFRITDICERLAADGDDVTVLTGLPNYPIGRVPKEYKLGRKRREIINGVNVRRCVVVGRYGGTIKLALNYLSFMISASLKALFIKKDFDLIYVYQLSPVLMALPGILMKKRTKKPLYLYCLDLWPESIKNIISSEKNLIFRFMRKLSRHIYSQCDKISVTSEPFISYLNIVHGIQREKINYIPQHAESELLSMDLVSSNDVVQFVYMGNIGNAQDIECILSAAERIKDECRFNINLIGAGSFLEKSKEIARQKGLDGIVVFHGRHPIEKMPDFYRLADACLITLKAKSLIGLTMPAKLQGYMAAGKPIIGAIEGAAKKIINESGCGVCVGAGDSEGLSQAMKHFIEFPNMYNKCGGNGRDYFRRYFTKETFMEKFRFTINEITKG